MQVTAVLVKAFTKNKGAGNPAGVILNADHLSDAQMQSVATELGFSESVFVSKSDTVDCKMRYFSVTQEVDYCAHASLAAGFVYLPKNSLLSYETKAGEFSLTRDDKDYVTMTQKKPVFGEYITKQIIARALGINITDMTCGSDFQPQVVSTGVPKLIAYVNCINVLLDMKPDLEEIKKLCRATESRGVYVFTGDTLLKESSYHTRQFNPLCGIDEDPITGIAAGALGAYISQRYDDGKINITVEQGYSMDKFGIIEVSIDKEVCVKGNAVIYGERVLTV